MKNKIIAIIAFVLCIPLQAQTVIDSTKVICRYVLSWPKDTTRMENIQEELMTLEVGNKTFHFFSHKQFQRDSIISARKANGTFNGLQTIQEVKAGRWKYNIYQNYPSNQISYLEPIFKAKYKYVENITDIQWNILSDKETILSYACQKATGHFKGRDYIAWFAPGIPISAGPYKFRGLPGLILRIADTKKHYTFECVSIEHPSVSLMYFNDKEYSTIGKKEFRKTQKEFITDPVGFMEFNYQIKIENFNDKTGKPEKLKSEENYNPIELIE